MCDLPFHKRFVLRAPAGLNLVVRSEPGLPLALHIRRHDFGQPGCPDVRLGSRSVRGEGHKRILVEGASATAPGIPAATEEILPGMGALPSLPDHHGGGVVGALCNNPSDGLSALAP